MAPPRRSRGLCDLSDFGWWDRAGSWNSKDCPKPRLYHLFLSHVSGSIQVKFLRYRFWVSFEPIVKVGSLLIRWYAEWPEPTKVKVAIHVPGSTVESKEGHNPRS